MAIIDGIRDLRERPSQSTSDFNDELINEVESDSEDGADNDDDSDSDEFYENESDDKVKKLKRPDTAKHSKRINLSKKSEKHNKHLRQRQLNNKKSSEPNNNQVKKENSSDTNEILDSSDIEKTDEDDERPFAANRADVQTVKVNQPRKPIDDSLILTKCDESKIEFKFSNDFMNKKIEAKKAKKSLEHEDKDAKTSDATKKISEKEQRISNLVNSIKEKQKKHEKRSRLMAELRPLIYGGTALIGGLVIHHLYKNFFSK